MLPPFRCLSLILLMSPMVLAQESEEEKEFLEFYYQNPQPDKIVEQIRDWSEEGVFANENARPALIGFLSQVIRQNRDRLGEWYLRLTGLSPEERQVFHTAMLYSRTTEADLLMKQMFGEQYEDQKKEVPKILEMPLDRPDTINMLWGFFYASGSESAVRRLIDAFRYADAPEKPDIPNMPKGYKPLYTQIPNEVAWMLVSNGERHPKILEYCEKIYNDPESGLTPTEKKYLLEGVLKHLKPEKYGNPDPEALQSTDGAGQPQ